MRKNKGFTYYELLIVIAIMSLMVGFTTIGIGAAHRNNVNRWADKIESATKQARNNAISKGNAKGYLNLYYKDNKLYSYVGEQLTTTPDVKSMNLIASNVDNLNVGFDTIAGHINMGCPSGCLINIGFKQSTGEVSGLVFPFAGPTKYPSDLSIMLGNGNNHCTVEIDRYGSISTKLN